MQFTISKEFLESIPEEESKHFTDPTGLTAEYIRSLSDEGLERFCTFTTYLEIAGMVTGFANTAEKEHPRLKKTEFEIILTHDGTLGKLSHFHSQPNNFRLTFDQDYFESLTKEEQKALLAHEIGHLCCGHLDGKKEPASIVEQWDKGIKQLDEGAKSLGINAKRIGLDPEQLELSKNQRKEREAIRMAVRLYPNPKAHIDCALKECYWFTGTTTKKELQDVINDKNDTNRYVRQGDRVHPAYASQIAEIVHTAKELAKEGLCEPVDEDYLRATLPAVLRTRINYAHTSHTGQAR